MNISRRHFCMLAIVSLFTGMIAPAVSLSPDFVRPYALTNMQYVAYAVFFSLYFLFILTFFRFKKLSYIFIAILIILVLSLGVMTITGMVKSFSGEILPDFSWGWFFLLIGLGFLLIAFVRNDADFPHNDSGNLAKMYEKIIGITGIIVLTILTAFVIFVAEKNSQKIVKNGVLWEIFSSGTTVLSDGEIISPAFAKISHFEYQRKYNFLTFLGTDFQNVVTAYPQNITLKHPENLASVHRFGDRNFFVQKDGNVIESGQWIGKTTMVGNISDFMVFRSEDGTLHLISHTDSATFRSETDSADLFFYNTKTKDVYWRDRIDGHHQIFKNGQPASEKYLNILRFSVADDGNILLIAENADFSKFIVKNNTTIHTIASEYVQWTLRMNNSDVLYAIKNSDESFSLVLNGVILERKLDEIRDIFIEQNSSGFAYFGRPQGEKKYCLFTRYRGNLCSLDSYMNPHLEADNSAVVFAGFREGRWSIYRGTTEMIRNSGYAVRDDISYDYFIFDKTNFRHYIFIEKTEGGYKINKKWNLLPKIWKDIDVNAVSFGYDKIFVPVQDEDGWKILEF